MDEAVVRRAQAGDHAAFTTIVDASIDRLYALASLIASDRVTGEDAVQDALIRAWRDLPTLRDPDRLFAWLSRLTINATYDLLRRHHRIAVWRQLDETVAIAGDDMDQSLDRMVLASAYARLRLEQKSIVVLHYYFGYSLDEVAATLGIPAGTARSRLHAALETMRQSVGRDRSGSMRRVDAKVS